MTRDDLSGVKVGDTVVSDGAGMGIDRIVRLTVERLTATQIITNDGGRWRRSDGQHVGSNTWYSRWIHVLDRAWQERLDAQADADLRAALATKIMDSELPKLPVDTLRQILAIIETAKGQGNA